MSTLVEILAVAGFVLASNAAVWTILNSRIEKLEDRIASQDSIDKLQTRLQNAETQNGTLNEVRVTWEPFILTLSELLDCVNARIDWHAACIDRLAQSDKSHLDSKRALAGDNKLARKTEPRLMELGLYGSNAIRQAQSAKALAAAVGDQNSLQRMQLILSVRPTIQSSIPRLIARLSDASQP